VPTGLRGDLGLFVAGMFCLLFSGLFPLVLTPDPLVVASFLPGFLMTVALKRPEMVSTYGGITTQDN
jgi:hypothetical protein